MPALWVELIYVVAQGFIFLRTVYQLHVSKKEKRSVTPLPYWVLTLLSSGLTIGYGLLIGSWAIPLITFVGYPFIFVNMKIELDRKKEETISNAKE